MMGPQKLRLAFLFLAAGPGAPAKLLVTIHSSVGQSYSLQTL